ncbi:spermatogenesis-associated protein 31D1-like [Desmodus rotundus]|uniref:spermatogenesis-associated protein 31D1-like n=1 Tax=Desmodus rotundus TaxID=9430 RepID=UPI00238179D1|nr:spermatogenesis-associated protein 31D1-like [Desmodus rotundus]
MDALERPLGQHHDAIRFHQRLCPEPSCEVYNTTTAELSRLPLSKAQEDSLPSASLLASTAPVTEPSFPQSPASSADPPGDLIPPPLPEVLPPTPSVVFSNPGSLLGNFLSPLPSRQTLPPEPFPPLESKFPVHHSSPQSQNLFSSNLAKCDFHLEFPALHSTKTSFGGDTAAKLTDPGHLLLSPDEHDSVQQCSYPKSREDLLKQKLVQLFWGLPSLHSESLTSAVPVSGDYSSIFLFNSLSNASTGHESPVLPYFLPPCLLELQPQPLPQTLSQSQPLPLTQIQRQAHLQPPLPILSYGLIPNNKACGVHFHGPQHELEFMLTVSEIQQLEWNVLQRKQECLKDLPPMVQKSKEDFCPSAPMSTQCWPSKAYVSISIDPVKFPLNNELQEKFEHHLRRRLIQHRWGLPRRIHESLSLMRPQNHCSDICESKSSYGISWISVSKGQTSQSGSFCERGSEMVQLEKDEGKDEGHSQKSDPKDSLSESETSLDKDAGSDSEKDRAMMSWSEENSVVSGQSESPRQLGKVVQVHLSKKFQEISDSQLPRTVHDALHTIEDTLSVKSNTVIKQRSWPTSVGGDYCVNTSQELSFLESGTQQMLQGHITKLHIEISRGLPAKVLESIEIFKLKDTSSHSLFDPKSSSSTNLLSEVNSKYGAFKPLRGSSKSVHGEKVGTENSATVPKSPLPATSLVGKEGRPSSGQGNLRQSPSNIKHRPVEEVQTIGDARPTLLSVTNNITGKASQSQHFLIASNHPPELPSRQAGPRRESEDKSVNSSDRAEMQLGRKMEKKAEPTSMSNVFREVVKAEELSALQYKTSSTLTTNKPGLSQRINVNKSTGTTPVTTRMTPPEISDPKSSYLNKQLVDELKSTLERRKNRQTQGQPTGMSHETNKASLPGAQGVSTVDMGDSQVLHVHLGDRTVSVEKQQEPWVPKQASRLFPDKNFPPALKKVNPTGSKSQELGGGDAGLVTPQPGRNRVPTQVAFEETVGSRCPQTLSQKRQSPPDSPFVNKMKSFFQRLQPRVILTKQENPQGKGSPRSCAQSRGPVRSRAAFMGMTEAQKTMSDFGKFPEERLGCRRAGAPACPQEPLPWVVRFGTVQQRAAVQVRAEPVQRPHLNPRAPACQSCRQAAVFAAHNPASTIYTRNDGRHPQKVGAFKDQSLYHQHFQSVPRRGTVTHHPSPTCRPHTAQGPPAALTTEKGTMFRDPCLRFRQKMLL